DPGHAGAPALVQGAGSDAERRHGPHSGDDDVPGHPSFETTRSTACRTVLMPSMSSPLSCTPYSSSTIWASSPRSSESTSSASNSASGPIWAGSAPNPSDDLN